MTVLVTGASGFLGDSVTRALRNRGRRVVAYDIQLDDDLLERADDDEALVTVRGDMTSFPQVTNVITEYDVSAIVPLAYFDVPAENLIGAAKQRPYEASNANVQGFNNVLEAARQLDVGTVVWPSSGTVYGPPGYYADLGIDPVNEHSPTQPSSLYAACKVMNEFMAGVYREQYDLAVACLRLPLVYGPGRPEGGFPFITDLFATAATGGDITIEDGDTTWDLMYKRDVGPLFAHLVAAGSFDHAVYNVAAHTVTVRELVDLVRDDAHAQADIRVESGDGAFVPAPLDTSRLDGEFDFEPSYPPAAAVEDFIQNLAS